MGASEIAIPPFLDRIVDFEDGKSYELLRPLTDFMSCHDGFPQEARILFTCRRINAGEQEFVIKIKVQEHNPSSVAKNQAEPGPSSTSTAEIDALEKLKMEPHTPELVSWKRGVQGERGPLPGGYITYILMTKIPGETLFNFGYREMLRDDSTETMEKRELISQAFLSALRGVHTAGIEPIDRGLRNVIWDPRTGKCGIIDFELWNPTSEVFTDDKEELMRWGLVERPPPRDREHAWAMQWR